MRPAPLIAAAPMLLLALAGCVRLLGRSEPPPSPLQTGVLSPNQAPIVGLPDVLDSDSIVGKRVRVLGWCVYAPGLLAGQRTGAWFLGSPDTTIEVRGLVPSACDPTVLRQSLVLVFAQVVRSSPGKPERLLLRLPD